MKNFLQALLIASGVFCAFGAAAQAKSYLVGADIELKAEQLAHIIDYFDFEDFWKNTPPHQFKVLPQALRKRIDLKESSSLDNAVALIRLWEEDRYRELKGKEPLPEFLKNYRWHFDKGKEGAIELSHIKPYSNKSDFVTSVRSLAIQTKTEDLINSQTNQFQHPASFHYHLSVQLSDDAPVSILEKARRLNLLNLLKILERGEEEVLTGSALHHGYLSEVEESLNFQARGIIRFAPFPMVHDPGDRAENFGYFRSARNPDVTRLEVRKHVGPLQIELDFHLQVLQEPDSVALPKLDLEIARRLTPEMKAKIFSLQPHTIVDYRAYFSASELQHWLEKMSVSERLLAYKVVDVRPNEALWIIDQFKDASNVRAVFEALEGKKLTPEIKRSLLNAFVEGETPVKLHALELLIRENRNTTSDDLVAFWKAASPEVQPEILKVLEQIGRLRDSEFASFGAPGRPALFFAERARAAVVRSIGELLKGDFEALQASLEPYIFREDLSSVRALEILIQVWEETGNPQLNPSVLGTLSRARHSDSNTLAGIAQRFLLRLHFLKCLKDKTKEESQKKG